MSRLLAEISEEVVAIEPNENCAVLARQAMRDAPNFSLRHELLEDTDAARAREPSLRHRLLCQRPRAHRGRCRGAPNLPRSDRPGRARADLRSGGAGRVRPARLGARALSAVFEEAAVQGVRRRRPRGLVDEIHEPDRPDRVVGECPHPQVGVAQPATSTTLRSVGGALGAEARTADSDADRPVADGRRPPPLNCIPDSPISCTDVGAAIRSVRKRATLTA